MKTQKFTQSSIDSLLTAEQERQTLAQKLSRLKGLVASSRFRSDAEFSAFFSQCDAYLDSSGETLKALLKNAREYV